MKFYLWIGLLFLLSFFCFTFIVKTGLLAGFDYNATVKIQNHVPKNLDAVLSFFSLLGSVEVLSVALFIVLLFHRKLLAFTSLFIFFLAHLIEIIGKSFLYHPGPPFQFFRYDLPFLFPSSYVQPGSSYPSGHSLRIIFVAIVFTFIVQKNKKLRPMTKTLLQFLIVAFTAAMLVTRISLGEHWSTDVIGGLLLGISFGLFSLMFL